MTPDTATRWMLAIAGVLAALLVAAPHAHAAAPAAPVVEAPVEPVSVRAVARFGFDRTRIDPADQALILAEVGRMKDVTWQSVTAVGHTDARGPEPYNQRLSAQRAQAVKRYLVGKGLPATMIAVEARGAAAPVADNGSESGRAQNRRAEIEFKGIRPAARP